MANTTRQPAGKPLPRSALQELETAERALWDLDRRRRSVQEAVWGLALGGRDQEHLAARLELAHLHMVARDVAARTLLAAFASPRPEAREADAAQAVFAWLLHEHAWHSSGLENAVRRVQREVDEARRATASPPPGRATSVTSTLSSVPPPRLATGPTAPTRGPTGRR